MQRYDNAELISANPGEQSQTFRVDVKNGTLIELAGAEQVLGVRVGDQGILIYSPEARQGRYSFTQTGRNPMVPPHCPRCQVPLVAGEALYHKPIGMTETQGGPRAPLHSEAAAATVVQSIKCPACGYSELPTLF